MLSFDFMVTMPVNYIILTFVTTFDVLVDPFWIQVSLGQLSSMNQNITIKQQVALKPVGYESKLFG